MNIKAIYSNLFSNLVKTQNELEPEINTENKSFFCPHCWAEISENDSACTLCGGGIEN